MSGLSLFGERSAVLGADGGDTRPMDEYARVVEAEFQEMKGLAEKAGWPKDLSAKIVDIDRKWQAAKATANAKSLSVVREVGPDSALRIAIRKMIETLRAGISRGTEKGLAPPYVPDDGQSIWKKVVVVVLACGTVIGGAFLLRSGK